LSSRPRTRRQCGLTGCRLTTVCATRSGRLPPTDDGAHPGLHHVSRFLIAQFVDPNTVRSHPGRAGRAVSQRRLVQHVHRDDRHVRRFRAPPLGSRVSSGPGSATRGQTGLRNRISGHNNTDTGPLMRSTPGFLAANAFVHSAPPLRRRSNFRIGTGPPATYVVLVSTVRSERAVATHLGTVSARWPTLGMSWTDPSRSGAPHRSNATMPLPRLVSDPDPLKREPPYVAPGGRCRSEN